MVDEPTNTAAQSAAQIANGARTIDQMAVYLEELKQSAGALNMEIDPVGRGYFVAEEEEQTHALLVSYCQTRAALHELIDEMLNAGVFDDVDAKRAGSPAALAEQDQRFLIGFAAALLLVDAARFIRSLAEGRPVVRKKLNQPVPAFGLAGGTYDAVQKSLLSARKGWRLIEARQYFLRYRKRLQSSIERSEHADALRRVWEVVAQTCSQMEIPWRRFFRVKFQTTFDRVLRGVGRRLYNRTIYNLQQFGSEIVSDVYVRPGHRPALDQRVRAQLLDRLRPGDVLAVRKQYALTNYFLPGFWPHAALYLGPLDELRRLGLVGQRHVDSRWQKMQAIEDPLVLEAMKDGVRLRSIASPFAADSIVVIRPALDEVDVGQAITRALQHEGKSYDFDFDFGRSDRLVCTEVVYRAYDGLGPIQFSLKQRAGRPTLSGADLLKMARLRDGFRPVIALGPGSNEPVLDYAVDELIDKHNE
jgi:hypothetical protein